MGNAVMWRFRVGSPWRDLPTEFGPWQSAYDRFQIRAKQGIFPQLIEVVIAEAAARGEIDLGLVVRPQCCRLHAVQHHLCPAKNHLNSDGKDGVCELRHIARQRVRGGRIHLR